MKEGKDMAQKNIDYNRIYRTENYDTFRFSEFNRPTNRAHINRLKKSLKQKNLSEDNPLLVQLESDAKGWRMRKNIENEYKILLEHTHLFVALKELKMDIFYKISATTTQDDIAILNNKRRNWKPDDYLHVYVKKGYQDYIKLKTF